MHQKIIAYLLFTYSFIFISPLWIYASIRPVYLVLILYLFCVFYVFSGGKLLKMPTAWMFGIAVLMFISILMAFFWSDFKYLGIYIFLIVSIILNSQCKHEGIISFVDISTRFIILLLIGSLIAFILDQVGIGNITGFETNKGRLMYVYIASLAPYLGESSVIRTSGIYDEPGAFSMFICMLAAIRHLYGFDKKTTWAILLLGFITFSVAHFVYVAVHYFSEKRTVVQNIVCSIFIALLVVLVVNTDNQYSERLSVDDKGELKADNRSFRMVNAYVHINENRDVLIKGVGPNCNFQTVVKCKITHSEANPLEPLLNLGLASIPYYFVVVIFLFSFLKNKKYLVLAGIGLLLVQRPYLTSISYSGMLVMMLNILLFNKKIRSQFK
jgi:hypothetical protein